MINAGPSGTDKRTEHTGPRTRLDFGIRFFTKYETMITKLCFFSPVSTLQSCNYRAISKKSITYTGIFPGRTGYFKENTLLFAK